MESYLRPHEQYALPRNRNRKECAAAEAMLDSLASLDEKLDAGQVDYLEILELLIEAYDHQHAEVMPQGQPPLERLRFLIEQKGTSSSASEDLLGSRPVATMVLEGDRELSKAHIRTQADQFKVNAGYFL